MTIANRASLGYDIRSSIDRTKNRILQIKAIVDKIESSKAFTEEEIKKELELGIIGIVSVLEQHMNDMLSLLYASFPKKLGSKKFELEDLVDKGSLHELFYDKANRTILDLAYGKFNRFVSSFLEAFDIKTPIDQTLVEDINEIKCTRDCLVHTDGKAESQYMSKAGAKARVSSSGKRLKIDFAYFTASIDNVIAFVSEEETLIPSKYKDSNRAYVFKQMWDATCLSERVKFEDAWVIIDPSMIQPVDIDEDFGFSSSEMEVYNLFRYIYDTKPKHKVDFALFFERWAPSTNEYQIAVSWLNNQFYF